jgi:hypothetical protein
VPQGVNLHFPIETELKSKVDSLLAIAYETRDLHVAELFAMERKQRRDVLIVELQKLVLCDVRNKVSTDYSDLDDVKGILVDQGFVEEVGNYEKNREAPSGLNTVPCDLAFVYKTSSTLSPCCPLGC